MLFDHEESEIDRKRKLHLSFAEFLDAWRLIPRILVGLYSWLTYQIISWYMELEPYVLDGCDISKLGEKCIIDAPTTGQSLLVSAIFGAATGIFGLYASTGRKWDQPVKNWRTTVKISEPPQSDGSPTNF